MAVGTSNYPTALDTPTELIRVVNLASSTIGVGGVTNGATTVPVTDATSFATDGVAWCGTEAISYTGKTATSLTGCLRGFDGTTAAAHAAGDVIYGDVIASAHHEALRGAIIAIETVLGATNGTLAPRALADRGGQVFNVMAYGAVGDGSTDDTTAVQAAFTAAAAGGGTVLLGRAHMLSSTITVTGKPVSVLGRGSADADLDVVSALSSGDYGSLINWSGGANPIFSLVQVQGVIWENFAIDGATTATYGIIQDRTRNSVFRNIRIARCATNCLRLVTLGAVANDNLMYNTFENLSLERAPVPLYIDGYSAHTANICHNVFSRIYVDHTGSPGVELLDSDNNTFQNLYAFNRSGGAAYGLRLGAWARNNYFYHVEAETYVSTPNDVGATNLIVGYDRSNGQAAPVFQTAGTGLEWVETGLNGAGWYVRNLVVDDEVYGAGWNGSFEVPTKNAVYDQIQTLSGGSYLPLTGGSLSGDLEIAKTSGIPNLTIRSDQAAGSTPTQIIFRRRGVAGAATPDNSVVGEFRWDGQTTTSGYTVFANMYAEMFTNTPSGAPALLHFQTSDSGGTSRERLTLGGSASVINGDGIDIDTVIRGLADDNLLYVDAGTDSVAIGNNAPTSFFDLKAGTAARGPIRFPSGTLLTTPLAGVDEFDAVAWYRTVDATNGRAHDLTQHEFSLGADGSAIGAGIADFFGANSAIPTVAGAKYEIIFYLMYTKTTAGTVTYTLVSTTAPTRVKARYLQSPAAGIGTNGAETGAAVKSTTATSIVLPATPSLTTAVDHEATIRVLFVANTAGNVRLRVTESAGTVTPLADSFYVVRRLPGNTGIFVA